MQKIEITLKYCTAFLIIAFPAAILHVNHGASTPFAILGLLGLVTFFIPKNRPLTTQEKHLFLAVGIYFSVVILSLLINGINREGLRRLELYGKFLLAIPFIYLLLRVKLSEKWMWYGLNLGALLAGVMALYEAFQNDFSAAYRVRGATHWILYGDLALAMAFMSLASIGFFKNISRKLTIIPVITFLFGFTGSILSGTRGAWIAIPLLTILLLWYYWNEITTWQRATIIGTMLLLPILMYNIPHTGMKQRISEASSEVHAYAVENKEATSVGARFGMWKVAWQIFLNNPVIGIGPGNYQEAAQKYVNKGMHHEIIAYWNHPHNEYLSILSTRGLLGFGAFLILIIIPGRYFFINMRNKNSTISRFGFAGMILIISYLHFALTEAILDRSPPVLFFTFYLTLLTYYISSLSYKKSDITDCSS